MLINHQKGKYFVGIGTFSQELAEDELLTFGNWDDVRLINLYIKRRSKGRFPRSFVIQYKEIWI